MAAVCSDMASVTEETPHAFADAIRLVIAQSGIKRQPYDAIGAIFGDREHARAIPHRSADRRRVQRHIMKYRMNAVALQVFDEPRSRLQVFDENVEHMEIAGAMLRDRLNPNPPAADQWPQTGGKPALYQHP